MYHQALRSAARVRIQYPVPSKCWMCGRFGSGPGDRAGRCCERCGVTWNAVLPGINPDAPVDQANALAKLRRIYMSFGTNGRPADIFDDFIDHGSEKLPSPA